MERFMGSIDGKNPDDFLNNPENKLLFICIRSIGTRYFYVFLKK
jgi:hypothetical protein